MGTSIWKQITLTSLSFLILGFAPTGAALAQVPIPMVWTLANGGWVAQELIALDGVDSEANAVAEVNGETVVGYGFTKKDAILRAVYWRADAQGTYGAPTRLGGLDGNAKASAIAMDVNSSGQVVGYSEIPGRSPRRPSTVFAVLWQLP